jgi:trehalose/maltose hydrolase-like predicted phosphorylase
MTTKKLNRRQTRWVELLAEFDFKIAYQLEKKNDKADSLIKRFENRSKNESDDRNKQMHQIVLSSNKVNSQIMQKVNDTKETISELSLFDKVKTANQKNSTCVIYSRCDSKSKEILWRNAVKEIWDDRKHFILQKEIMSIWIRSVKIEYHKRNSRLIDFRTFRYALYV